MKLWGVDLGGTKIECAVIDGEDVLVRRRAPTEAERGYDHIISQVKKLISEVSAEIETYPERVGFATPGVLDPDTGLMKNCNTVVMNRQPMQEDLQNALQVSVRIANDANCFALAESFMGAGRNYPGAEVVFGVIMGTGVGGGLVVHDRIIEGVHGITGEWGHNILEDNGEPCYCGKRGCVETVISGTALENYYRRISGNKLKLKEITSRHLQGIDELSDRTIERLLEFYGRAVSTLINVLDPNLIIIGGGVGNIDLLYTDGRERVKKYLFNSGGLKTPILKPVLGDSAGVFGAALLQKEGK
jgi:predicted NBD/HSP70 family sugar kinase